MPRSRMSLIFQHFSAVDTRIVGRNVQQMGDSLVAADAVEFRTIRDLPKDLAT